MKTNLVMESVAGLNRLGFSIVTPNDRMSDIDESYFDYLIDSLKEILIFDKHAARLFNTLIKLGGRDILNDRRLEKFIDTYIEIENANYGMIVDWIQELQNTIEKEKQLKIILKDIVPKLNTINIFLLLESINDGLDIKLSDKINLFCRGNKVLVRSLSGQFKINIDKDDFINMITDLVK